LKKKKIGNNFQFSCPPLTLFGITIAPRLRHREIDSPYDAQYHVERYLDKQGIFLDILDYKFEDIEDLIDKCRQSGDIECNVTLWPTDDTTDSLLRSEVATPLTHLPEPRFSDSSHSSNIIDGETGLLTPVSHETPFGRTLQAEGSTGLEMVDQNDETTEEETGRPVARRLEFTVERTSIFPRNLQTLSFMNLLSGQRPNLETENPELHEMQHQNLDSPSMNPATSQVSGVEESSIGREMGEDN
jgi:hypothetical protein